MRKTIFKYGILAGIVSAALMFATTVLLSRVGFKYAELVGYIGMMFSFLPVFVGVRKYRDTINGGALSFGNGVAIALATALISNLFYVAAWLFIYYQLPDVTDKMLGYSLEQMKNAGRSQHDIDTAMKQIQQMKDLYKNPLVNAGITFTEPLPMSLIFSLITGAILRRKPAAPPSEVVV
jgi:hypothetical protein